MPFIDWTSEHFPTSKENWINYKVEQLVFIRDGVFGMGLATSPLDLRVTDSLVQSMIELAQEIKKLGIRDIYT